MSLEAAAGEVAERLLAQEFVEVIAHHDADGIASASIVCHALLRADVRFQLKIRQKIPFDELQETGAVLLCDFGSAYETLPPDMMVIDHHVPRFEGGYQVNPRLHGIDGDRELSSAGAAYMVAQHMGENRDLAGLALVGMIGDDQECTGKNQEICSDGMANGFVVPHRGFRLPGRDLTEQLFMALSPHLTGISGEEASVEELVAGCTREGKPDLPTLLSAVILTAMPGMSCEAAERLYGDTYELERELFHDAHTLAAIVEACGQAGFGGLGASLCLRDPARIDEAWEVARSYRMQVIEALRSARRLDEGAAVFEVDNPAVTGAVADALAHDHVQKSPVAVLARSGENCRISARRPPGLDLDMDGMIRTLADSCGGTGGGHPSRAGATIPASALECFTRGILEAGSS
jgi:single-stranded-DNA-specific exonuclease